MAPVRVSVSWSGFKTAHRSAPEISALDTGGPFNACQSRRVGLGATLPYAGQAPFISCAQTPGARFVESSAKLFGNTVMSRTQGV